MEMRKSLEVVGAGSRKKGRGSGKVVDILRDGTVVVNFNGKTRGWSSLKLRLCTSDKNK